MASVKEDMYFGGFRQFTGNLAEVRALLADRDLPDSAIDLCTNAARSTEFDAFFHDEMRRIVVHFNEMTKSALSVPSQTVTLPLPAPVICTPVKQANVTQQHTVAVTVGNTSCSSSGGVPQTEHERIFMTPPEFEGFVGVSPSNNSDISPLFLTH
jgi:hypothetical protein